MTDITDSTHPGEEQQKVPTSGVSQTGDGQPHSQGQDFDTLIESLISDQRFAEALDRRVQSIKDRRFTEIEKRQSEIDDRFARYEALRSKGLKPEQAREQLKVEDDIAWVRQFREAQEGRGSSAGVQGSTPQVSKRVEAILGSFGMDKNDPGVTAILNSGGEDEAIVKLVDYAQKHKEKTGTTGLSAIAAPVGGSPASPDATKKYIDDIKAARGNRTLIKTIKTEARKAGVDVDNIGFKL